MSNKSILILIIAIIVILSGIVFYIYNKTSDQTSDNNINIDETEEVVIKGPAINITPERYDLGTVVYGEVASHTFVVKNLGDQPLEILKLSTSCGCTEATIAEENKIIASGQSVDMLVTFDSAVHKDDSDLGDVIRTVYIETNDPKNPEVEVEIIANVIKEEQSVIKKEQLKVISITAKQWSFDPNPIKVKKGDLVRLEITSIDVAHGFALPDFNIDEVLEPGKKVSVEFLADKTGSFPFFCSISCGRGHYDMSGMLIVE